MAPLRRKSGGSSTPEIRWRHCADNLMAPLRRQRNGSYTPKIHRWNSISLELLARRHLSRQNGPILANSRNGGGNPLAVRSADSASSKKTRTWLVVIDVARGLRRTTAVSHRYDAVRT